MGTEFGIHLGQQNVPMDTLRGIWKQAEEAKLDWISLWDHFYEAPPAGGTVPHFEALTTLGALAADTKHIRIGCLVFCVGYRNPAMLAKAATTVDHISGGRFELGLGAGWHELEARAYGYDFPSAGTRIRMLEEAAILIRQLLTQDRTTYQGDFYHTVDASCLPAPVQKPLPICIGGTGVKKVLRIVAKHADVWSCPYVSPERFRELNAILDDWCVKEGRPPEAIRRTLNLAFALSSDRSARPEDVLAQQWGASASAVRKGAVVGHPETAAEQIMPYVESGAHGINLAIRVPYDKRAFDAYLESVPELRKATK
jgi:alkanesulfonate monooxygenase SsuD/methylene tetrahydromethanopterin reductase-like flavin-dependent oxidoreductase (luciferase family)